VTAFAVDRKRRWNTAPRWRRCLFHNLRPIDFQATDLIKLNSLKTWVGNRQRFTGDGVTRLELVFGVSAFPHANKKFSGLASDVAAHPERVTEIGVAALIERAAQANPRLDRNQHTLPRDFLTPDTLQRSQAARFSNPYS
jgi:hypothetical protein